MSPEDDEVYRVYTNLIEMYQAFKITTLPFSVLNDIEVDACPSEVYISIMILQILYVTSLKGNCPL